MQALLNKSKKGYSGVICKQFGWKPTAGIKADAQKVGIEIDLANGIPEKIIKKAQNKKSELYKCYEWDSDKMMDEYLRIRTRYIVNHIIVEYQTKRMEEPITIRAFESVKTEEGRIYINVVDSVQDKDLRNKIFDEMKKLLIQAQNKMNEYTELIDIIID